MHDSRLTFISDAGLINKVRYGNYLCQCGNTVKKRIQSVKTGNTKSCGCLQKELQKLSKYSLHGKCTSRTYNSWTAMKSRCKDISKPYYHGRNITYCERWNDFKNFLADMGERPDGMTLDRIDSNGNYEPSNCKWSTNKEQSTNRRNNVFLEFGGKRQTVMDWSRETGFSFAVIHQRIKLGWTVERALTQPIDTSKRSKSYKPK
jgi:hypothetical protein